MTDQKIDYPPLLPGGLHPYNLSSLKGLTVDEFPDSHRRRALFSSLEVYLDMLAATGLRASVWVDGSFMCSKQEPDDIDLVVAYDPDSVDGISESALPVVNDLLNTNYAFARFRLHVFKIDATLAEDAAFWMQKFGTQRDEITPKGLAELKVNP